MNSRSGRYLLNSAFAAAAALRILKAVTAPVTHDEAWTVVSYIDLPLVKIFDPSLGPNNHFFNTLAINLFNHLGDSLFILRLPSMLAALGFLSALLLLARRMNTHLGLLFFSAAAFHPYLFDLSIMARGYSYGLCFIYISLGLAVNTNSAFSSHPRFQSLIAGAMIACAALSIPSLVYPAMAVSAVSLFPLIFPTWSGGGQCRRKARQFLMFAFVPAASAIVFYYSGLLYYLVLKLVETHYPPTGFFAVFEMYSRAIEPWAKSLEFQKALVRFTNTMVLGKYYSQNLDIFSCLIPAIITISVLVGLGRSISEKSGARRCLYLFGFVSVSGFAAANLLFHTGYPLPRHFCWLVPVLYLTVFDNIFFMVGKLGGGRWSYRVTSLLLCAGLIFPAAAGIDAREIKRFRFDLAFPELFDRLQADAAGNEVVLFEPDGSWYYFLHMYYERIGRVSQIEWTTELGKATHFIGSGSSASMGIKPLHDAVFSNSDNSVTLYRINPAAPLPDLGNRPSGLHHH